ncbi:MAG: c-type cytochrome [Gammaproteobacteria bacterium]|nr:c-type cytochrome [Gammaproteobacteria bacterium]
MRHGVPPAWVALWFALLAGTAAAGDGEYLFHAAGCAGCHTRDGGPALAGGRRFDTAFGAFYSPNITPDRETGIGEWTAQRFIHAVKHGTRDDGSAYFPVFPYPSYRLLSDDDASAIFDYLMTLPAHRQANREHDLPWWLARWMIAPWQWWIMEAPPEPPRDTEQQRGWYLVDALGHCGECHTPRKFAGVSDRSRYLGGNADGPEGDKVPNITPDRKAGIGKWSADDLAYFLETGALPDGDYTGSTMAEVVDNTTSKLTRDDRAAIVRYLRAVPPLPGD